MRPFFALVRRDLRLATRIGGDALTLILFFVLVAVIVPFAVGPDRVLLARLAPAIVWIAALLSVLLGLDRLFHADHEDGSLFALRQAALPLEAVVLAKLAAHWIATALPLIVTTPVLAALLNMSAGALVSTMLALAVGTPALVAFGAIGASVTVSLRRGGLIAPVLILPLSIPILIFGVGASSGQATPGAASAALIYLSAISLLAVAFAPFGAALALRMSAE
ncbi:MAG TPA: heme exporter protein CcmB [Devosiaceae bacterium]